MEKNSSFIHKVKNHFKSCIMIILSVGMMLSNIAMSVQATGANVTEEFPAEIQRWHRLQGTGIPAFFKVDGEVAWCIEPGKLAHVGQNNEYTIEEIGYSRELGYKLAYIAYYGYKVNPTIDNYVLTQNLLWETIGTKAGNDYYFYVSPQYPSRASQKAWQDAVMAKVNSVYVRPSFNNSNYILNVGESITLTDTNGVLGDFVITGDTGNLTVLKNGNQLTITATSSSNENSTIRLTRNFATSAVGSLIAFKLGDSQAVSSVRISDPAQAYIDIKVNKKGNLKIAKQDNEGNYVPNTTFKISYNSDMSSPIGTYTTGSDGTVTINDLLPQTIYIQETAVPEGLVLDSTIKSITVQPNQTIIYTQTNTIGKGSIIATKQDAETGSTPQGEATLQGATYELAVAEDIIHPSTGKVVLNKGTVIDSRTTNADGSMSPWENLYAGKYVLYETKEPTGYQKDNTQYQITVTTGHQSSVTVRQMVTDRVIKGSIKVFKKDADNGKTVTDAPATFELLNWNDEVIQTAATDSDGSVTFSNLPYGHYSVREKHAPEKYTLNEDTVLEFFINENGEVEEGTISNHPVKGSITLTKEFDETETGMTGEATLEGVTYELHAHEDILDPADGSVLYTKDSVIPNTSKQTGSNGKITWTDLYLGSYDVHEVLSNGTVVINTIDVTADLEYIDQNTPHVSVEVIHKDKPNEQAYSLIKISSDGSNGEVPALEGAEFTTKLKSDVDQMGWDAAPTYDVSVTDSKGYLESGLLPYGTYIVRETKTPDEHYTVPDFTVEITVDSDEPQVWKIFNDKEFEAVIALVKKDTETGKTVQLAGTTFKIRNLETNEFVGYWEWNPLPHYVDQWTTDESGSVMTGNSLKPGNYQIEEITAPNGYVLNTEPVKFTVSMNTPYQTLPDGETPVITVTLKDVSAKGQISVYKEGEQLTGVQQNSDGSYSFIYETLPQPDTQFEIIADADILDPSNDGTLLYEKDEIVETITTGSDGYAVSSELPLGDYRVEEIKVQDGMVLNTEIQKAKLEYEDQLVEVVSEEISFKNDRQKVSIELTKKDDEENLLSGAVYGLYTKTDLMLNDEILLPADTLIETGVTDENGKLSFKADLPISLDDEIHFYVKEIKQPAGYVLSDAVFDVDTKFKEQTISTINNSFDDVNAITKIELSKKDITTEKELPGTHILIVEKETEDIIDDYVSMDEPHLIKGLEVGKTYLMIEESSPYGFAISETVEFTVAATGDIQKVEMKDDLVVGKLVWNKTGEIFTHTVTGMTELGIVELPVFEKSSLLNAEITIYAAEDIMLGNGITYWKKDEAIQTLESDWEAVESRNLLVGSYYYVETKTPVGYVPDTEKHYFEIEDNQSTDLQVIESTLLNDLPSYSLDFTKTFEEGYLEYPDAYKNVVFGIFTRDDTYDYLGNVAIEPDTLVATVGIDEEGHLVDVPRLPVGNYYLRELSTNRAYLLDESEYDFRIDQSHEENVVISINDGEVVMNELKWITLRVNKVDADTGESILDKDFTFTLYSDEACSKEIMTVAGNTEEGYAEFEVPYGIWYLKETSAPEAYLLSDEIVKIEYGEEGIFINDEKIETEETYYSFDYTNKSVPSTTVNTGDDTPLMFYLVMAAVSASVLLLIFWKHRKNVAQNI